jgi:(E)-4-hydroxy-3-methyl-but-2-enyl pyrophosphate reductase
MGDRLAATGTGARRAKKKHKVVLGEAYGYCFGVRRAVEIVERVRRERPGKLTTLGPIIHNPQVVARLQEMGIDYAARLEEIPEGIAVMSAHGVPPKTIDEAKARGLDIVDVVCPFVTKVHRAAEKMVEEGYEIVILGDEGHTEVKGVIGSIEAAGGSCTVISDPEDAARLGEIRKVGVVCQTTQRVDAFAKLVANLTKRAYEVRAFNTICGATEELQSSAVALAKQVDVVLVIGGKNSANTRRLRSIVEAEGVPAYHVETAAEIEDEWLDRAETVGVTAGASTPDFLIDEVLDFLTHGEMHVPGHRSHYDVEGDVTDRLTAYKVK